MRAGDAHRHLLDKPYRDKLQGALEEHFGRRLRVEFTLGQPAGLTPAELEDRERQEKQREAVQAIDSDPFVRELVENFDARVVDRSTVGQADKISREAIEYRRQARGVRSQT